MKTNPRENMDFDAFVKRERTLAAERGEINWAKERDAWLRYLENLYAQIKSFLADYRDDIEFDYRDIELNEENIGSYRAPEMILKIGRQEITIIPIGTLLIGTKGRVDIVGRAGRTRLVLVDRSASGPRLGVSRKEGDIDWVWKIATSPPTVQYIELTRESFFQAILEVANG